MNLALFFEGTRQGVRGKRTNVSLYPFAAPSTHP